MLLANQFHDSFECLSLIGHKKCVCAQSEARICRAGFAIFLYRRVHMQTLLFAVRLVLENCDQEEFSVKMEPKKPRNSILKQRVAMFTNLASISPQSDFFNWCIFHWKLKTLLQKSSPTEARQVQAKSRVCSWTPSHKKMMVSDWAQIYFFVPNKRQAFKWVVELVR